MNEPTSSVPVNQNRRPPLRSRLLIGILSLGLVLGTGMAVAVGNPTVVPKVAAALSGKAVTDFTVVVGPGFLNRMFDFSSTGIFRANGTVIVNGLTTITVTRPDSSVISFRQRTDTDGRMRGFVYASVINQVGTYQIQIDPDEGGVASASFQITNPADAGNLTTGTLNTDRLSPDFLAQIGGNSSTVTHRGASMIAAEESVAVSSDDWATMPTPDEVTVTLPEDGLLTIGYQGESAYENEGGFGWAAIFLNESPLKIAQSDEASPENIPASISNNFNWRPLVTNSLGLMRLTKDDGPAYAGDVVTGQVLGGVQQGDLGAEFGSVLTVFAEAGTYTVGVRYQGANPEPATLKAKNRKLWVKAEGY